MKRAKEGVSGICRKRRPRSAQGACRDEAGVYVRVNGKRIWRKLGAWGSPEVKVNYHRVCLEFETCTIEDEEPEHSLAFLFEFYLNENAGRLSKDDLRHIKTIINLTLDIYPALPISKFTAMAFRAVRKHVVGHGAAQRPHPWSRNYANKMLRYLKTIINWGMSFDIVPPEIAAKVESVPAIHKHETELEEREDVQGVPDEVVCRTLAWLSPTVADMIRIQRGACMRPKEVRELRVGDIDKTGRLWFVAAKKHKTDRFGITRFAAFSQAETEILRRRCQGKGADEFVFCPRDAMAERWAAQSAARKTPITPSQRQRAAERQSTRLDHIRDHYTADAYSQAISYGIAKAAKNGVRLPHWHPYQLRHQAVTTTSLEHDRETASLQAGHTSLKTTEVYDHKAETIARLLAEERKPFWMEE